MKTFKTLAAVVALVAMLALFVPDFYDYGGDTKSGRALSDIQTLEHALLKLAADEDFTAADWERLDLATEGPRLAKMLEQGTSGLIDPWGEPYVLEKREQGDRIVVTLRSKQTPVRKWYRREKVLGIELVISRPDGSIIGRKDLWR